MEDKRNILIDEKPFYYKKCKENKALIFWKNKIIKTIYGKQCEKLEKLAEKDNDYEVQLYLAELPVILSTEMKVNPVKCTNLHLDKTLYQPEYNEKLEIPLICL